MKNRTTWEMPEKPNSKDKYGNVRRNPYRNQIDYVIVRRKHLLYVTNAQSYTSINTETDHKLVIMKTKIKRSSAYYCKQTKKKTINYANFQNLELRKKYHDQVKTKLFENNVNKKPNNIQEKWDMIVNINKKDCVLNICSHHFDVELTLFQKDIF